MDDSVVASVVRPPLSALSNMFWIPGGTFRLGSDKHYREEAPVHRVTVSGFWIDRTPVTNRQFKQFVFVPGTSPLRKFRPTRRIIRAPYRTSTAGATGRPHAMRKRWTRPRATSDSEVSSEQGARNVQHP